MAAEWPAPANVHAFTTLRHGAGGSRPPFDSFNLGLRSGDDEATVLRNRAQLVQRFGLPAMPCWLRQVHGVEVVRFGGGPRPLAGEGEKEHPAATSPPPPLAGEGWGGGEPAQGGREPEADAAVTGVPGTVLAVLSADCLPVVLASIDGDEVAAAHAGWRGLAAGVLERTVAAMRSPPGALLAWLGPAAGAAYEVGEEVRRAFLDRDAEAASAFVATRPGHWRVDLYALARRRLAAVGVTRVHGGGLCTISEPGRFHSHRRDGRGGRMATVVWFDAPS